MTLQQFIAETIDHPDRNTFIAMLFKDILNQLPFDSFSPHNVFVQKSRSGFVRARLGLKMKEDIHFVAPEPEVSIKSSIWSAGVCLYYMITERSPFNGATDEEVPIRVRNMQLNLIPPATHKTFKLLLNQCLCGDPERRVPLNVLKQNVQLKQMIPPREDW